jgi:hypothetical protein
MADKNGNKTGGRAKGVPNKRTLEMQEKAQKYKWHPFDILMLYVNRDHDALGLPEYQFKMVGKGEDAEMMEELTISPELQVSAAKAALKYLAPELKAIEHAVSDETVEKIKSYEEYLKSLNKE